MTISSQQWYIRKDGVIHGPASAADLKALLEAQRITLQQEASYTQEGPWRPLTSYEEFAPVRPIAELFESEAPRPISDLLPATKTEPPAPPRSPGRASASPTALRLLDEALNDGTLTQAERKEVVEELITPEPRGDHGSLTPAARTEFREGLSAEIHKNIGDKPIIWACVVFIVTLALVAGFNKLVGLVLAVVFAGVVYKFVKETLEKEHLQPIAGYSDEMLVARYNEVKADRRAASTRAMIGWAVIVIIGVILTILWLAARQQQ